MSLNEQAYNDAQLWANRVFSGQKTYAQALSVFAGSNVNLVTGKVAPDLNTREGLGQYYFQQMTEGIKGQDPKSMAYSDYFVEENKFQNSGLSNIQGQTRTTKAGYETFQGGQWIVNKPASQIQIQVNPSSIQTTSVPLKEYAGQQSIYPLSQITPTSSSPLQSIQNTLAYNSMKYYGTEGKPTTFFGNKIQESIGTMGEYGGKSIQYELSHGGTVWSGLWNPMKSGREIMQSEKYSQKTIEEQYNYLNNKGSESDIARFNAYQLSTQPSKAQFVAGEIGRFSAVASSTYIMTAGTNIAFPGLFPSIGRGMEYAFTGTGSKIVGAGIVTAGIGIPSYVEAKNFQARGYPVWQGAVLGAGGGALETGAFVLGATGGKGIFEVENFGGTKELVKNSKGFIVEVPKNQITSYQVFGKPVATVSEGGFYLGVPKASKFEMPLSMLESGNEVGWSAMSKGQSLYYKEALSYAPKSQQTFFNEILPGVKAGLKVKANKPVQMQMTQVKALEGLPSAGKQVTIDTLKGWGAETGGKAGGIIKQPISWFKGLYSTVANKNLGEFYGGFSMASEDALVQNPYRTKGMTSDVDVMFRDMAKPRAEELVLNYKNVGVNAKVTDSLVELPGFKGHGFDLHGSDFPDLMLQGKPFGLNEQAVNYGYISEQAVPKSTVPTEVLRKFSSVSQLRLNAKTGAVEMGPTAHRSEKDITDLYYEMKFLSEKAPKNTQLALAVEKYPKLAKESFGIDVTKGPSSDFVPGIKSTGRSPSFSSYASSSAFNMKSIGLSKSPSKSPSRSFIPSISSPSISPSRSPYSPSGSPRPYSPYSFSPSPGSPSPYSPSGSPSSSPSGSPSPSSSFGSYGSYSSMPFSIPGIESGWQSARSGKGVRGRRPYKYQASLYAKYFNIRASKIPKSSITGISVRPIISIPKLRRRK